MPDILSQYGLAPKHVYEHLLNGFSAALPSNVAEALAADPRSLGLGFAGLLAGAIVVLSGIVPIKASSGHWRITAWFLHFSMGRSISTHTLGTPRRSIRSPRSSYGISTSRR